MRTAGKPNAGIARPIRGVNLGNWLVLERWMESPTTLGVFAGTTADDEKTLRKELAPAELAQRLERHRCTSVSADTFAWLADVGCNLVRIPVPFFVFGDETHESCIDHLDHAFDWAAESGLPILMDLHTVPGGQNGFDNGGASGLCTWHLRSEQMIQTLEVLERLALRYAGHPALFGIEPMNEPASPRVFRESMRRYGEGHPGRVERSMPIPHAVLTQFYRLVHERLRPLVGPHVALVFHDQFMLGAWNRFMPADRYPNVWIDTHQYVATYARVAHISSLRGHLALARGIGARIALAQRHHPILVGEWSLSQHIRSLGQLPTEQRAQVYRTYAAAQLAAFERGMGSCFWSLRNGRYDDWSLEACLQNGWLDLQHGGAV